MLTFLVTPIKIIRLLSKILSTNSILKELEKLLIIFKEPYQKNIGSKYSIKNVYTFLGYFRRNGL